MATCMYHSERQPLKKKKKIISKFLEELTTGRSFVVTFSMNFEPGTEPPLVVPTDTWEDEGFCKSVAAFLAFFIRYSFSFLSSDINDIN